MRRTLFQLHLWVGLIAGLAIVALGLSGSALVYRADIERWTAGALVHVEPMSARLSYDSLVAEALAAHPGRVLTRFRPPAAENESLEVVLQWPGARDLKSAQLVSVFIDPYRGAVLGSIERASGPIWWLQDFHYALLSGVPGLRVNGFVALLLVLLAVTGPVLWWPGKRNVRQGFRVRWRSAPARWVRDLHAVGGLIASLLLIFVALTACYFAFRGVATTLIQALTGDPPLAPPVVTAYEDGAEFASLDALVAAASALGPGAILDEVRPARRPGQATSVAFRRPGEFATGRNRLYLDPRDASVVRVDLHERLEAGQRAAASMAAWHFGSFGGRATQAIWFVLGLVPAFLFGSGTWLWWRKRRRTAATRCDVTTNP